jgi:quercetin dioxygenase-like cupin family protein
MERNRLVLVVVLCSAAVARADGTARPAVDEAQVAGVAEAQWNPVKLAEVPAGAWSSLVAGDPKTGPSVAYAKFPPGFAFPAHRHTHHEYSVLLSGKASFTLDGKQHALLPGSYVTIPGGVVHSVVCEAAGECLLLTRRAGPTDYQFEKK